jgi:hypothetical protein
MQKLITGCPNLDCFNTAQQCLAGQVGFDKIGILYLWS